MKAFFSAWSASSGWAGCWARKAGIGPMSAVVVHWYLSMSDQKEAVSKPFRSTTRPLTSIIV